MKFTMEPSQYWLDAMDEENEMKKLELWNKGTKIGDINCYYNLGEYFTDPNNPNKNLDLGIELLNVAAENGHSSASYYLALAYYMRDKNDDSKQCLDWMCIAASRCVVAACMYVEAFYAVNEMKPIIENAFRPFISEMETKDNLSGKDYCQKGLFYEYGILYPQDSKKATECFQKGKELGNGLCETLLRNNALLMHKKNEDITFNTVNEDNNTINNMNSESTTDPIVDIIISMVILIAIVAAVLSLILKFIFGLPFFKTFVILCVVLGIAAYFYMK